MKDERNRENDGTYTDNRSLAAEGIDPEGYSERYYYYYVYDRRSTNSYCSVLNLLVRVLIALKGRLCYINKERAENGNICYFLGGGGTFVPLFNDIVIPERSPG